MAGQPLLFCRPLRFLILVLAYARVTQARGKGLYAEDVRRVCGYTRFPGDCVNSLLSRPQSTIGRGDFAGVASALVEEIREELTPAVSLFSLKAAANSGSPEAIKYCNELMGMSSRRLNQSMTALEIAPAENKDDIQTWLSAVLTFQEMCKDSLESLRSPFSAKVERLAVLSSNALAIANRIPARSGSGSPWRAASAARFPKWVSKKHLRLLAGSDIKASAVVAADGSGDFTCINDALASAASQGGRSVIFLRAGVYKEKLIITKDDVMLIGEGNKNTIITHDSSVSGGTSMPDTATVAVTGDRFIAKDIRFENTAGPFSSQALALRVVSDRAVFFRCSIRGYQDTLFAQSLRQFYRDCEIQGTIDFIFGNAAAVFQNCSLVFRRPRPGAFNAMMANGRTDPGQNTGFVAQKCRIQAGSELSPVRRSVESYLGRPWKEYSRAVVIESSIDDFIHPEGWSKWIGGFALKTLYFAEGLNKGAGAGTSDRVDWPGFHVLNADESSKFTVSKFLQGTSWLPSTGVTYKAGLYAGH